MISIISMFAIAIMAVSFLIAITKKDKVWPVLVIFGIVIFSGIVHGSLGLSYVHPAAFSFWFKGSLYVRIFGTCSLLIVFISRLRKFQQVPNKIVFLLLAIPFLMGFYYVGALGDGFSHGPLGIFLKTSDVLCFYGLTHLYCKSQNKGDVILKGIAILGVIFLLINCLAAWSDQYGAFRAGRFRGVVFSTNWAGSYFALFLVPLLSQYLCTQKKYGQFFWVISLLLCMGFIVATGSRGAVLSSTVYIMVFSGTVYLYRVGDVSINKVIFRLAFLVLLFSLFSLYLDFEWIHNTQERFTSLGDNRTHLWQTGLENWLDGDMFFGSSDINDGVENMYLSMLFVYGIFGFSILAGSFSLVCYKAVKNIRRAPSLVNAAGFAMFTGFVFNNLFEAMYMGTISAFNLFVYIGLGLTFGGSLLTHTNSRTKVNQFRSYKWQKNLR